MKYRAFWKDTWYESEDYGALCRVLSWVGVQSFYRTDPGVDYWFRDNVLSPNSVVVERVEDED